MRKWFIKGVAIALAMSMSVNLSGFTVLAAGMDSEIAVAAETAAQDKVYTLNSTIALKDEAGTVVTQLQGNKGTADDIKVDATNGKFAPRATDTQVNAGTVLSVPVAANENGVVLTVKVSGGAGAIQVNGTDYAPTTSAPAVIELPAYAEDGTCDITVTAQTYLSEIAVAYKEAEVEFPGKPGEVEKTDKTYTLNTSLTMTDETGASVTQLQGNKGTADDIKVDATNGKFALREGDTQVNATTVLYVPVAANEKGATVTVTTTGDAAAVTINGTACNFTKSSPAVVELAASATAEYCVMEVTAQSYLKEITVAYKDNEAAFPGEPGEVAKTDKTYTLNTSLTMTDETGTAVTQLQGNKGTADDIKVDASAGKFAPRANDVQVNAPTTLYVPVAANEKGATVTVTTSGRTAAVTINGEAYSITTAAPAVVELPESAEAAYCVMEVTGNSYLKEITVAYKDNEAAFPGVPETAEAKDIAYTLNSSMTLTDLNGNTATQIQSGKGIACGDIKIDATAGKFAPRSGDTQITNGTILYVPVAPDAKGATVTVSGNNYNNLDLTWNGEPISVGTETVFETPETAAYYALEFGGESGSCYATGITIDYKSDDTYAEKTVTVGQDKQYQTITEALAANTSSAKDRLTLVIDPGDYEERVIVEDPYVTFKNADPSKEVVIHERYFSSNKYDEQGNYAPQDKKYDIGTGDCGTVIVKSTAAGFRADHITFKNDYNMTYKTEKGTQTPAVALNTRADKVILTNCKILGRQDTFYPQGAGCRVVLKDCYIEGTVDFIFGDADAYFEDCQIHMAPFAGRDSGYFVAPNTKMANTGLVFYNCKLTVDESYTNAEKVSLGRPWQTECESTMNEAKTKMISYNPNTKKAGYESLGSAATFIECQMSDTIKSSRFSSWTRKLYDEENPDGKTVVVSYDQDVRFAEINTRNLSGELLAEPETLTPYTTVFRTGLSAEEVAKELAGYKKNMAIGEGTTWVPEVEKAPVVESVEKPALTGAEGLVYDGTEKSVSVAENAAYTVSGTLTAADAGTYEVIVSLNDTEAYVWADGTTEAVVLTWSIAKADQTLTVSADKETVEAGQTAKVTVEGAKTAVTYSVDNKALAEVDAEGNVTAKAEGKVTVTASAAADTNYNAASGTVSITITKKAPVPVEKPVLSGAEGLVYDGTEKSVSVAENAAYTVTGDVKATNAGTYTVTVSLSDTEAYVWADGTTEDVTLTWSIAKADQTLTVSADKETVEAGQTAKVTVEGAKTAVSYIVDNTELAEVDAEGNVTAKAEGKVTVTAAAAADANYNAAEGTVTITITKKAPVPVEKPVLTGAEGLVYDGTEKSVSVAEHEAYTVSGTLTAANAGTYTVTVSLNDTEAYVWADGTTEAVVLTWSIAKADQTLTVSADKETVEAGQTAKVTVEGAKTSVTYSVDNEALAEVDAEGTVTAKAEGTVTVTASAAADENHNAASGTVSITITKKAPVKVEKPGLSGAEGLVYDGTEKSVSVAENAAYTVSGDVKATNAGTYTVTVSLNDTEAYVWADGTTEDVTLTWSIAKADQTLSASVNPQSVTEGQTAEITVTGAEGAVTYVVDNEELAYVDENGVVTAKKAGEIKVAVKAAGDDNYESAQTSVSLTITKKPAEKVEKPVLEGAEGLVYDGTEKSVSVAEHEAYYVSGTSKAVNAGTYTVTVSLRDTEAYVWADGTTADVTLTWSIAKADQNLTAEASAATVEEGNTVTVTAKNAEGNVTYSVSDETVASINGNGVVTAKKAGKVTVTVKAAGNNNYLEAETTVVITVTEKAVILEELDAPEVKDTVNKDEGIYFTWEKVEDASGYRIFRKTGKGSWARLADTVSEGTTSYLDKTAKEGTEYTYAVRAYRGEYSVAEEHTYEKGYWSAYTAGEKIYRLATPELVECKNYSSYVLVDWDSVKGASGYIVYRKGGSDSSWKRMKKVSSKTTSWKDSKASNGTYYTYTVRAYKGSSLSDYDKEGVSVYRLSASKVSSAKNTAKGTVTVKWSKNSKVTGYKVRYDDNSKFSSAETITVKSASDVSEVIKGLKKGKTCYVKVICYKTYNDENYYSAWSSVKKVKVSK